MTTNSCTLFTHEGGIGTVTINRPDKLNALNRAVIDELHDTFAQIATDDDIRVVVLTGSGDKAFVAGADISEINTLTPVLARDFARHGQNLMTRIEQLGKPVIAAINGYALGGGCELAMACTIRIGSDHARLGLPEISLGIMPGFGGTQRLARLAGRSAALELTLTGRQLDAEQALQLGLLSRWCLSPLSLRKWHRWLSVWLDRHPWPCATSFRPSILVPIRRWKAGWITKPSCSVCAVRPRT